ncbi:Uncharacterized protein AB751O23_BZ_00030 [Chlamydiales bacterium SCGC AB-751-O23]|jgi:hypothetical protein|nr:Uncharacterized protein AB751O23_BZ_00030 [Chlamydiales bacterium SCGC AB-751-O23]
MKYRLFVPFIAMLVLLSACRNYQSPEFTRHYDDGRVKPKVALVPVTYGENFTYPWDLSKELTEDIRQEVQQQSILYLPNESEFSQHLSLRSSDMVGPHSPLLKSLRQDHDFVVLVDLLEHSEEPYRGQSVKPVYTVYGEAVTVLKMALRVTIFDVRESIPKSILQEIVHSNHMISRDGANTNYHKVIWKTDAYKISPFGLAHSRLSKEVANRLNQYISVARS